MDPIVAQSLAAVQSVLTADVNGRPTGVQAPVSVQRSATPVTGNGGGLVSQAMMGSGYLGVESEPAGSALNPIAQLGLFARIRQESSWLRFTTFAPVSENTGYLDTWDDRSFRMHASDREGPRRNIPLHKPDVDQLSYSTTLVSGAIGLRLKAIRAAQRAGQDVNALIRRGVAAGIGNVLADLAINGNTALPADTELNKQRRVVDGWFQQMRDNSANYQGSANGFAYHNQIWPGMIQQIDKPYRSHKGLAWGLSDSLSTRWLTELSALRPNPSNAHPSIVNDLGSQLLNAMGAGANPLGKPSVILPQLEDDKYSSDEGYTGIAPSSITNNGDGTLTIDVDTLADSGTDRSSTGTDGQRYMVVGRTSTGVEETLAIDYAAPNNTVTTTSLLGQSVVSTTASDYYIRWADTQSMFLGVWQYLVTVIQNGMRVYTVFYPQDEVIEIIVHMDLDYLVVDYDATSLTDDIITPRFSVLPT